MDNKLNFEQNIKELEEVVRKLEAGDIPLDELLKLFEKGVGLTKDCNAQLDTAEQKINMLVKSKNSEEMETVPMSKMQKETVDSKIVKVEQPQVDEPASTEEEKLNISAPSVNKTTSDDAPQTDEVKVSESAPEVNEAAPPQLEFDGL